MSHAQRGNMTRARDLANIISGGFTVDDLPTLTANEIPNLDAAKITSGTFADARIAASNVSQHAQSFDDNKIVNDISTLALRQASNENKAAYNTNSMYVDVFQDATGIDTTSSVSRNNNEYVSSVITGSPVAVDYFNPVQAGGGTTKYQSYFSNMAGQNNAWYDIDNTTTRKYFDYTTSNSVQAGYVTYSPGNTGTNTYIKFDFKETKTWEGGFYIGKSNSWGDIYQYRIHYSLDDSTYYGWDMTNTSQSQLVYGSGSGITSGGTLNSGGKTTSGDITFADNGSNSVEHGSNSLISGTPTIQARYFYLMVIGLHNGKSNNNAGIASFQPLLKNETVNATGNFTGTTITAPSSVSSMGAIITYQDNAGTNALNTDIILKLSADGGSNYSTATLTAMPDFASGIKMAKVNDLSVTAGTSLKYKLEFANQASGSKEARIRGVSLQY